MVWEFSTFQIQEKMVAGCQSIMTLQLRFWQRQQHWHSTPGEGLGILLVMHSSLLYAAVYAAERNGYAAVNSEKTIFMKRSGSEYIMRPVR